MTMTTGTQKQNKNKKSKAEQKQSALRKYYFGCSEEHWNTTAEPLWKARPFVS